MTGRPDAALFDGLSAAAVTGVSDEAPTEATVQPFDLPEVERYRRGHLIGTGGMGRVTQAFDGRLGREVALKEILDPSPAQEARLAREAAITARLDHPGVVVVHDAGRTADGALFYTMRVVRGRTLDAALTDAGADRQARMRLLRHVLHACEAIAFAHSHGVIHRDLKPANIMVGEFGETQVLDWGLAVTTADLAQVDDAAPAPRGIVGTPRYMSPEQASGAAVDARADVWSLGAVLFEVCAGRPARIYDSAIGETALIAAARTTEVPDLRRLAPDLPRELAALVARATDRDPDARYPDAKALADDLGAYLDGRRVAAHSYSAWDLLARLVRAWRVPLTIAALAIVATAVGVGLAFKDADNERDKAVAAEKRARLSANTAEAATAETTVALGEADAALSRLLAARAIAFLNLDARPEAEVLASHALALGPSPEARGVLLALGRAPRPALVGQFPLPDLCRHATVTSDAKTLACVDEGWTSVWDVDTTRPTSPRLRWRARTPTSWGAAILESTGMLVATSGANDGAVFAVADGKPLDEAALFCCGYYPPRANIAGNALQYAGTARVSVTTATSAHNLEPCATREEMAGAVDESGTRWAVSCRDGSLFVGDLGGDQERFSMPLAVPRGPASAVVFAPDGETIFMGSTDGHLVVYDLKERRVLHDVPSGVALTQQVAVSPDGRWAVVVGDDGGPRLFDVESGTWRGRLPDVGTRWVRFLKDVPADLITIGPAVQHWRLSPGAPWAISVDGGVTSLAPRPDGEALAVTRGQGVDLVAVADGRILGASPALGGIAKGGAFTADGEAYIMTAGSTMRVTRWYGDAMTPAATAFVSDGALRAAGALGLKGARPLWLAIVYRKGVLMWPDGESSPLPSLVDETEAHILGFALAADGSRIIGHTNDETLVALDATAPVVHTLSDYAGVISLGLDVDGEHVIAGERGGASLIHAPTGDFVRFFDAPQATIIAVALSPDGRFVAGGDAEGRVIIWKRATGEVFARLRNHTRRTSALAFAPDGSWLATGSWDQTVRFYALGDQTGELPSEAEGAWGISLEALLD